MIVGKQGGEDRAKYGDGLIEKLSPQLSKDFEKDMQLLTQKICECLQTFQKSHAVRDQLL